MGRRNERNMFKVGDVVKLREGSIYRRQSRGYYGAVITDNRMGNYKYRVDWDNGNSNSYRELDLDFAIPRFINNNPPIGGDTKLKFNFINNGKFK